MKRNKTILFSIIIILSFISLVVSVTLSVIGNVYPSKMTSGNIECSVGYLIFLINISLLILVVIFMFIVNKKLPENYDFRLKFIDISLLIIGLLYCAYRIFFFNQLDELLSPSNPTLMIYLAIGIFLDIVIITCLPKMKIKIS